MQTPTCFLCERTPIFQNSEQHCEFNNKRICSMCIEKISTSLIPVTQKPIEIHVDIKEDATIQIGSWEKCDHHSHKKRLICITCNTQVCVLCVPLHNTHTFSSIEDLIVEMVPKLHELEYLSRYAYKESKEKNEDIDEISNKIVRFFNKIQGKSSAFIYSKCKEKIIKIEKNFKHLVLNFRDKNLSNVLYKMKYPVKAFQREKYLHFIQWKSSFLYLYNKEFVMNRIEIKDYIIPHFSRSIATPKGVLICGGRLEADSKGLRRSVLISLSPVVVKHLPDMNFGKANHTMLYYDEAVYTIGGCDHDNKYSNRVERYLFESNKWEILASTNKTRDSSTAIIRESEKAIYVFGGRYGGSLITNSIEKYIIESNIWVSIDLTLTFASMVLGSVKITDSKIMVFAGQNEISQPIKKCNLVDLEKGQVQELCEFQKGGCIVNEPILFGNKVACLVFLGAAKRQLHFWNCESMQWDDQENND